MPKWNFLGSLGTYSRIVKGKPNVQTSFDFFQIPDTVLGGKYLAPFGTLASKSLKAGLFYELFV